MGGGDLCVCLIVGHLLDEPFDMDADVRLPPAHPRAGDGQYHLPAQPSLLDLAHSRRVDLCLPAQHVRTRVHPCRLR